MSQLLKNPLFSKRKKILSNCNGLVNPNTKNERNDCKDEEFKEVCTRKRCRHCHTVFRPKETKNTPMNLSKKSIPSLKHRRDTAQQRNNDKMDQANIVIDDNTCVKKEEDIQNLKKDVPVVCLSDEETETTSTTSFKRGRIRPQKITSTAIDFIPLWSNPREEIARKIPRKEKKNKSTTNIPPATASKEILSHSSNDDCERLRKPREIIVDGLNVAMTYTKNHWFSEEAIIIVVDFFLSRGHVVKVFVPHCYRSKTRLVLEKMFDDGIVIFTPSRRVGNERITSYSKNYILEYAIKCDGVIVSLDPFLYLYKNRPEFRKTIETQVLPPTFVGKTLMFPPDPLGRMGPSLTEFLSH